MINAGIILFSKAGAFQFVAGWWGRQPARRAVSGVPPPTISLAVRQIEMRPVKLAPLSEGVTIPFFTKNIDENGKFNSDDIIDNFAGVMLQELLKWTEILKPMRSK